MTVLKKFLLALVCAWASVAHATTWQATVNGTLYDFSTVNGSYDTLSSTLTAQFWWGNGNLANQLVSTTIAAGGDANAFFAYDYVINPPPWIANAVYISNQSNLYNPANPLGSPWASASAVETYVIASPLGAPEIDGRFLPQTFLLLGGFTLFLRRGKRRVLPKLMTS